MSRHSVPGGDRPALLACLSALREKTQAREGQLYPVIAIQEAGLDGFRLHRALETDDGIALNCSPIRSGDSRPSVFLRAPWQTRRRRR